ncbi:MAG: HAMP domain-containing sensor histidine kinase [Candidatus Saccharibacteria bacterium]|nr:HAMP domain-containing sensor histidine kinase [Candidatus Saccharibacteria bacterium]
MFLDEFNKELVANIDLESLLNKCSEIVEHRIKPEFCLFGLKETAYSPKRIIGQSKRKFDQEDISFVRSLTPGTKQLVIVSDELEESSQLKTKLRKYDIAVLARLTNDISSEIEGLGYLILGVKKSGNPYNKQDLKMIEIITNELVIAVQNALRFEEIEKFNVTLQEKVDSATSELQRTNEKLKQMDETKDEFISMASHQLRTPLTSVKGYLSMILEGDVGKVNKQQNKMLEQAFLSSQRMVYLIADLLNVSRLKTGKFVIDPKEANLADIVETEVEQLKPSAKARDLTLTYKKPKDFPMLMIDETKIRQVIMNFIDNAIYYTPSGGNIDVSLEDKGKTIEYRVKDTGIGVPKAERHNLFGKFYRAENARKARPDGTGLGLFMAKKVVVAQGGAIIFESEEGKGSTFGFSFAKEKLAELKPEQKTTGETPEK